jgi:hypothetical protein
MGRRRSRGKNSTEVAFDGSNISATTRETSATISLKGYSVSGTDVGKVLVIRGGTNFIIGPYLIKSIDAASNTCTLDRLCTSGAGAGMTGKIVHQEGRWHRPVPEYYQADLPDNPGEGEARQRVLDALDVVEPSVLQSLAETCLKRTLLEPEVSADCDWPGPLDWLLWGHVRLAGQIEPSPGGVTYRNLQPLKDALTRWAKDEPQKRWNLCDSEGQPLDWIAEAAVDTLTWWQRKGHLPKRLRWVNLDLYCYRSLDSDEAVAMFEMERHFDAGSGYIRISPGDAPESSRLPDRAQRTAKKEYKTLGRALGLTRMQNVLARYFEWYALRTFLGLKLRKIRERELQGGSGIGVGDPLDAHDLSAIAHGIKKVADLVGFQR